MAIDANNMVVRTAPRPVFPEAVHVDDRTLIHVIKRSKYHCTDQAEG